MGTEQVPKYSILGQDSKFKTPVRRRHVIQSETSPGMHSVAGELLDSMDLNESERDEGNLSTVAVRGSQPVEDDPIFVGITP